MTQDVQSFFARLLQSAPPELPAGLLRTCAERYVEAGKTNPGSISDCIQKAGRLFKSQQKDDSSDPRPLAPATTVSVDLLCEQLRPEVEAARLEIFGSAEPPFGNPEEAVAWIKARARGGSDGEAEPYVDPDLGKLAVPQIWEKIEELVKALGQLAGGPVRIDAPERIMLEFMNLHRGDSGASMVVSRVHLPFDSKLLRLKSFTGPASQRTGFPEWALVAHVLVGISLSGTVPNIEVTLDLAIPPRLPKTTVIFRKADVRRKDLTDAYRQIQQQRIFARDSLDETDRAIIEAMRHLGPPPPKNKRGRGEYWEKIRGGLEKDGIELSVRAIEMRRNRFSEKGEAGRWISRELPP